MILKPRKSTKQKMKLCNRSNIAEVTLVSDDCDHNYKHFERCQEAFEIENNAVRLLKSLMMIGGSFHQFWSCVKIQ